MYSVRRIRNAALCYLQTDIPIGRLYFIETPLYTQRGISSEENVDQRHVPVPVL